VTRLALSLVIAYLAGAFPTAWLAGKARGVDIGRMGSGNYGATNVYRTLGVAPAIVVVIVDVAKGFLPVAFLPRFLPVEGMAPVTQGVALAVAAVLGHVYSVFLGFRGGKGVGTAAGAYLALAPWAVLGAAVAWLAVVALTRIVSLASLVGALALLAGVVALDFAPRGSDVVLGAATALLVVFVFWTHRANIARLIRGEERRIVASGRPPS
jgi:glycerol-3-phosphate acyltransferase PlsY